jgi:hypothetical protein
MHHPRQLTLLLDPEPADNRPGSALQDGTCPVCGASLVGHRSDAVYCGAPCRAEASRVRRLREGQAVDGYRDLAAYSTRQRRTERDRLGSFEPHAPSGA